MLAVVAESMPLIWLMFVQQDEWYGRIGRGAPLIRVGDGQRSNHASFRRLRGRISLAFPWFQHAEVLRMYLRNSGIGEDYSCNLIELDLVVFVAID